MKIWQVTENDNQMRFYWFATKKQADAHASQYRKEMIEKGDTTLFAEVEPLNVKPTREGIARALNNVISMTCFNEG